MKRRRVAVLALVAALALGCSEEQAPDVVPDDTGPSTTSQMLAPCPDGGPDATTPPAGCLDDDGRVVRP